MRASSDRQIAAVYGDRAAGSATSPPEPVEGSRSASEAIFTFSTAATLRLVLFVMIRFGPERSRAIGWPVHAGPTN
jgi:hypothetical protein